jgi:SAM-dependent methyltransferase
MIESTELIGELVRLHHAAYQDDIPFWIANTKEHNFVLELGCGHGRVSLPLIEAGRKVIGLDRDWQALLYLESQIRSNAPDLKKRIYLIQANMFNFFSGKRFDSIIIPCNTYSSISSEERKQLLGNLAGMLHPGGLFIISMPNPEQISFLRQSLMESDQDTELELETTFRHPDNNYPVQVSSLVSLTDVGVCWEWIYDMLKPDGSVERHRKTNSYYLSSMAAYTNELRDAGFEVDTCLGDYDGSEFKRDAPRLIFVAKST